MPEIIKNKEILDDVKIFFEKQSVYKKIVDHDYTGHKEIYQQIHNFIKENFKQDFSLLDLGCGNSAYIAKALKNTQIKSYLGIDLSPLSLQLAKENIKPLTCKATFLAENFSSFIENTTETFDIIFMGLSLHHLFFNQKEKFLIKLHSLITKAGVIIVFDTFLNENESRADYLVRWHNLCYNSWVKLTSEEKKSIEDHVTKSDYPETFSTLQIMGQKAGFKKTEVIMQKIKEKYGLVIFYK